MYMCFALPEDGYSLRLFLSNYSGSFVSSISNVLEPRCCYWIHSMLHTTI